MFENRVQQKWNTEQRDYLYHDDLYVYRDYPSEEDPENGTDDKTKETAFTNVGLTYDEVKASQLREM